MKTVVSTSISSVTEANNSVVPKSETESNLQFSAPLSTAGTIASKRPISLDLNKPKKQRLVPLLVDSSDVSNFKPLNTPDIEKILLSNNLMQTPQPGHIFPTKVGPITSEQEAFGKGFEEALHSLHNSKNTQAQISHNSNSSVINAAAASAANVATANGTGMSGGSFTYTNLESNFPVAIKDEPQNPPASPPVSPIDMETQEKIKLERKRQRNRVAASKCRKRKLERISKLEDKVKILKGENTDLGMVVKNLKDHVAQLKQKVIEHIESGCSIQTMYNGTTLLQNK